MKKLFKALDDIPIVPMIAIILIAIGIMMLSGCDVPDYVGESQDCKELGGVYSRDEGCLVPEVYGYYTKEEVDEMLQDYYVQYVYLDSIDDLCNTITYNGFRDSNDCAESLSWLFDNWEELSYFVDGGFTEDIEGFEEYVIELELRIEELERE
jgi:hypothetical protein